MASFKPINGTKMHGNKELATNGYKTILVGPWHPPYGNFCPGPGHHIATLAKGNGLENANLQVFDKEGGIRQIVFAVSGRPLD